MIAQVDTLTEKLEHTPIEPYDDVVYVIDEVSLVVEVSIDEVSRTVSRFLGDGSPQEIREESGDTSISEMLMGTEPPRFAIEFSDDNYLEQ